jgi:hypothetical protein
MTKSTFNKLAQANLHLHKVQASQSLQLAHQLLLLKLELGILLAL